MSFPDQTTITNNTATLTCEITGKTNGKVAAFYQGDIRTPSGGNSITSNPVLGKYVADCNISFQSTETSELTFTIKWMDTNGDIYVCTPNYAITAGDIDGGFPGSPIVFTASSTPEGGGAPTSFPDQTTITNNTATLTCEITGKTSGKVAAFYQGDIRTPSGGNSITLNPVLGKSVADCNISFQSTETSELTFTIKWMDTNGDIYVCTPNYAITAGDIDGGFPGSPIVFTASSTPEGGGTDTVNPVITSGTTGTDLDENSGSGQIIYTIEATDNVGVTGYAIAGTDANLLSVDPNSGVVTLTANPDYENKSSYSFDVTANDGTNTSDPLTVTFVIRNANDPTTGKPAITLSGTGILLAPIVGDILTANPSNVSDEDGMGTFSYKWANNGSDIIGATGQTYTLTDNEVGGKISVIISFTDNLGNQEDSLPSIDTGIVAAKPVDDLIYFWTVYDSANDNTAIHYGIYNTTKISGVQFTYDVSGSTTVVDVSYSIVDNSNNNTMIHKKDWPIHIINNRTNTSSTADDGVANKAMIFAGAVNQTINGMNTGVFAVVQGNVTLASIVAVVDEKSDLLATDQYALGEPANPPEITEPGGRKLGDINFDGAVDSTDEDILEAYLLNDTTTTFTVYDDGTTNNATTGKTAEDIITDMTAYDWQTYVDVNNNGIIDVGDLVRLLSKVDDSAFSMTNGT